MDSTTYSRCMWTLTDSLRKESFLKNGRKVGSSSVKIIREFAMVCVSEGLSGILSMYTRNTHVLGVYGGKNLPKTIFLWPGETCESCLSVDVFFGEVKDPIPSCIEQLSNGLTCFKTHPQPERRWSMEKYTYIIYIYHLESRFGPTSHVIVFIMAPYEAPPFGSNAIYDFTTSQILCSFFSVENVGNALESPAFSKQHCGPPFSTALKNPLLNVIHALCHEIAFWGSQNSFDAHGKVLICPWNQKAL